MDREESKRVHHEFEKFYQAFPKFRMQANHGRFLNRAEDFGGSEFLSADNMSLWIQDPEFKASLAELPETPEEAFEKLFAEYPAFNKHSNRQMLLDYIHPRPVTFENLEKAILELGGRLAFDESVAEEQAAQAEQNNLDEARRLVAKAYSRDPRAQQIEYARLQGADPKYVLERAEKIRLHTELSFKSKAELRELSTPRKGYAEMPDSISAEFLTTLATAEQLRFFNQKYGAEQVNARLGHTKPTVQGNVQSFGGFMSAQGIQGAGDRVPSSTAAVEIRSTPNKPAVGVLPSEITARVIKKMSADEIRGLNERYGRRAVNDRIQGKN